MATNRGGTPKLEIAIAELSVLMKSAVSDIADIKNRMAIMDEQYARKSDVETNRQTIEGLKKDLAELKTDLAVSNTKLSTWGIVGGIVVTLLSAVISAFNFHL